MDTELKGPKPLGKKSRARHKLLCKTEWNLDRVLASQGGICTVTNSSCCVFIDQSGRVSMDVQEIRKQTQILQRTAQDATSWGSEEIWTKIPSWVPSWTWLNIVYNHHRNSRCTVLACIKIQRCSCCNALHSTRKYKCEEPGSHEELRLRKREGLGKDRGTEQHFTLTEGSGTEERSLGGIGNSVTRADRSEMRAG